MSRAKKAIILAFSMCLALTMMFGSTVVGKTKKGADEPALVFETDSYSKITHYMHMIYEHYTVAGKLVQQNKIDDAILHLRALMYYVDLIPDNIPEKDRDGKPINKDLYMKNYDELKKFTTNMIQELKEGAYTGGAKPLPPPDVITKTCDDCHKNAKIVPPW